MQSSLQTVNTILNIYIVLAAIWLTYLKIGRFKKNKSL